MSDTFEQFRAGELHKQRAIQNAKAALADIPPEELADVLGDYMLKRFGRAKASLIAGYLIKAVEK